MRGRGLRPISRHRPTRGRGDSPFWILCDGVDYAGTKNAIRSNKQDLTLRDLCFSTETFTSCYLYFGKVFRTWSATLRLLFWALSE